MPEQREVLALIQPRVRWRFSLDAAVFAERVQQLLGTDLAHVSWREALLRLSLDDLYLASACVRGEDAAWQELAQLHFGFIRSFARRYLGADAATETADEVIADLWERRKLERYQGRSSLRTWLGALVAHRAINVAKADRRQVRRDSQPDVVSMSRVEAAGEGDPENDQARGALRAILADTFAALPAETRLLLQLYYEQELTLDEMSRALAVSSAVLSRRLKQTREQLRASIEAQARERTGIPVDTLRAGLDLGRLDVDLGALLNENCRPVV